MSADGGPTLRAWADWIVNSDRGTDWACRECFEQAKIETEAKGAQLNAELEPLVRLGFRCVWHQARAFVEVHREDHKPGDPHLYRIECEVCGQIGMLRLTVDPERVAASEDAPVSEPQQQAGIERQLLEAAAIRAAILELQRERGRLSKVTVGDYLIVHAGVRQLSDDALRAIDTKEPDR